MELRPVSKFTEYCLTILNNQSKLDKYTASELNAEIYITE
ncbi:conserved protein of unknown function [Limnospira indica PCC 8005]|uniref:Uncharacterized protein n=1 Tax=Limnospira indica PCC 8005 TaxID=376219 RepID=A0A9P1KGE2_9CYAN|nr:conserved protein of unknown function [Limnospira indica PCC 8005]